METAELQDIIFAYMQKMKGKKKLKEKDVIRAISEETSQEKDTVKKALGKTYVFLRRRSEFSGNSQ
jgi:predicted RNA-binding protein (virulence factor B family)